MNIVNTAVVLVFVFVMLQSEVLAEDKSWFTVSKVVDVSKFNPTSLEVRKSVIKSLMHYNWKIQEQTSTRIKVTYENNYLMYVDLTDHSVLLKGTTIVMESRKKVPRQMKILIVGKYKKWFRSVENIFSREVELLYHLKQAEKLSKSK